MAHEQLEQEIKTSTDWVVTRLIDKSWPATELKSVRYNSPRLGAPLRVRIALRRWVVPLAAAAALALIVTATVLIATRRAGTDAVASGPNWTVQAGCPQDLGPIGQDGDLLHNTRPGTSGSMLPADAPLAALVCAYGVNEPSGVQPGQGVPAHLTLDAQRDLTRGNASQLQDAVNAITLTGSGGSNSCGSQSGGLTFLVFEYDLGPDIALKYRPDGCPLLTNGDLTAGQVANPSFDGFSSLVARLLRPAPQKTS